MASDYPSFLGGEKNEQPISESLTETFRNDPYAVKQGFRLRVAAVGYALVEAEITRDILNFGGVPHGGFLFSLADYAFSVASNSHGQLAVATNVSIQFMAAASVGERIFAEARESKVGRSAGFYEMTVWTENGKRIAQCLGVVHRHHRDVPGMRV